jgi:hypothetical protein
MKNLLILSMVFLAACSKSIDEPARQLRNKEKENCSFGVTQFNLTKRATVKDETNSRNKKPTTGGGTTTPSATTGVILLDFNGHIVTGTSWNVSGDINCAPANLSSNEISLIVQRATNDYSPFNIFVTTDESVYNNANNAKRMRVVITETWEWYGQSGGVAYINSFGWADNTPCFVFSSLLNYNVKMIAEACSHEAGHTLGLRHQSTYDGNCIKTSEYNYGQGTGETGWAPIMGAGYNQNLTLWHKGPNSISCSTIQDDVAIIAGAIGFKTDDYSNTTANAASLTGSADGIIANSDVDFFSINLVTTKTISLIPFNVGIGNAGANLDMVLKIYNTQGQLISAIDNSTALNAATVLSPGNYYVSASTAGNLYTSAYGMLGKYTISLN